MPMGRLAGTQALPIASPDGARLDPVQSVHDHTRRILWSRPSEFLPNFILGETVEPIEDNTTCATSPHPSSQILAHTLLPGPAGAWSYLVATNFTETIAVLAFLAVQQPTVPTITVEAVMFMLMYVCK